MCRGVVFGWLIFSEGAGKSAGAVAGFMAGIILVILGEPP
jgi:hypothetical protein